MLSPLKAFPRPSLVLLLNLEVEETFHQLELGKNGTVRGGSLRLYRIEERSFIGGLLHL
jgi:hypothetical protein